MSESGQTEGVSRLQTAQRRQMEQEDTQLEEILSFVLLDLEEKNSGQTDETDQV